MKRGCFNGIRVVLMVALMLSFTLFSVRGTASADEIISSPIQISTSYVDDISDTLNTGVVSYVGDMTGEVVGFGSRQYMLTFTLDSDSYVEISEFASIWQYNFCGDVDVYLSSSPVSFTKRIISSYGNKARGTYRTLLGAGTYYLRLDVLHDSDAVNYDSYGAIDNPYCEIYVKAQRVTGNKGTLTAPANVTSGTIYNSFISKDYMARQVFQITIPSTGKLDIGATVMTPPNWMDVSSSPIKFSVCNSAGQSLYSFTSYKTMRDLPAGTYLIICDDNNTISWSDSWKHDRCFQFQFLVNFIPKTGDTTVTDYNTGAIIKPTVTPAPVVTPQPYKPLLTSPSLSFKSKTAIKGKCYVKGCKVYLKVGGKTYTKAVKKKSFTIKLKKKLKNGQKVKVWCTKSGYRNSAKATYKVVITKTRIYR